MITEVEGYECTGCEALFDVADVSDEHLYQCNLCGNTFVSDVKNCPSCNKFAAKEADIACPECQEAGLEQCGIIFQVGSDYFKTRAEAEKWVEGTEEREAMKVQRKVAGDSWKAEYDAEQRRIVADQLERYADVSAVLFELVERCPDDHAAKRWLEHVQFALGARENGDTELAYRQYRDLGQSIMLPVETLLVLLEMVDEEQRQVEGMKG